MTDHGRVGTSGEAGSFVGRERELRELRRLVRGARALTPPKDRVRRAYTLSGRAVALAAAGRLAEAHEATAAALALMLEAGHEHGAARIRLGFGDLSRLRGDLDTAPETARCLTSLGRIAADQGELGAAREYLAEALRLSLASGSRDRGAPEVARLWASGLELTPAIIYGQPRKTQNHQITE